MRLAHAKTNLFIEVPEKRPDGFHELDTVFVELEVADVIHARSTETLSLIVLGDAEVPTGPENLVWRAAEALRRHAGRPDLGAELRVEKSIPVGGGLGGGSSNAAATLQLLDAEWELNTPPEDLHHIATSLGSDVPFFLRGGLQRGRGRGERLEPLAPLPSPLHVVLVFPEFGCPTQEVYRSLAPFLPDEPRCPDLLIRALASGDAHQVGRRLFNRLEPAATASFPQLTRIREDLLKRPAVLGCVLSGSGSTFVCLTADAASASDLASDLERSGRRTLATRTAAPR